MDDNPILALDFASETLVWQLLDRFPKEERLFVKIGMELFYQTGPDIVKKLTEKGHDVFLDLKLHDIPNTVERAMKGLAQLDIKMVNVHAAGGRKMMEAAKSGLNQGLKSGQKQPILLAVTQLTSTSEQALHQEQLIMTSLDESVIHYAKLAEESGLDGVVCSALEVQKIKQTCTKLTCLTPGIRLESESNDDQVRIMKPDAARQIGSDYIVVGRPITQAADPYAAYQQIKSLWRI